MEMIAALCCLLVLCASVLLALEEAKKDAWLISQHMPVDHVGAWCFRAAIMSGVVGLLLMIVDPWAAVPLLGLAGSSFSALFRWQLNGARRLHTCYIAPWSNAYDRLWYGVLFFITSIKFGLWVWPGQSSIDVARVGYTHGATATTNDIHRAGRIAYVVEIAVSVGCVVWMLSRS